MEFTVSRGDLVRELARVKGVVATHTTIPLLANVLIETGHDCVFLSATNLELGLRCTCPAVVGKSGSAAIPAKRLLDYVRLLPEADLSIQVKIQDNHWASLTCGKSKARIAGMSSDNFPELPKTAAASIDIPGTVLADAISRVSFAISKEASRFTLNGALMVIKAGTLTLVATDGHRLAYSVSPFESDTQARELVPLDALMQLAGMLKEDPAATVGLSTDENNLFFMIGTRVLIVRKMTGTFPDYERVLPKDAPHMATIDRAALNGAVGRVSQFSDERSKCVRVTLSAEGLKVQSSVAETGDSEETVDAEHSDAGTVELGFNANYILDFLRSSNSAKVQLLLKDSASAGEFRLADDDNYRVVIMPMRL